MSLPNEVVNNEMQLSILMEQYGDMVKTLAYSYVKDMHLADEIAQDVFFSCYNHLDTFKGTASYKTWIYRITVNRCKDVLKSRRYKELFTLNTFKDIFLFSKDKTPEENVIQIEEQTELSKALFSLPAKYREILFLFYYEELKMNEIKDVTGLNLETIKTRLHRGKKLLKGKLEGGL